MSPEQDRLNRQVKVHSISYVYERMRINSMKGPLRFIIAEMEVESELRAFNHRADCPEGDDCLALRAGGCACCVGYAEAAKLDAEECIDPFLKKPFMRTDDGVLCVTAEPRNRELHAYLQSNIIHKRMFHG